MSHNGALPKKQKVQSSVNSATESAVAAATRAGQGVRAQVASLDVPGRVAALDLPGRVAALDLPGRIAELDIPGKVAALDIRGRVSSLDLPNKVAELDIPGKVAALDVPGKVADLDIPGRLTDARREFAARMEPNSATSGQPSRVPWSLLFLAAVAAGAVAACSSRQPELKPKPEPVTPPIQSFNGVASTRNGNSPTSASGS